MPRDIKQVVFCMLSENIVVPKHILPLVGAEGRLEHGRGLRSAGAITDEEQEMACAGCCCHQGGGPL